MASLLLEAKEHVFPDGHSKAFDMIERLHDFDELEAGQSAKLVTAIISSSHDLLGQQDERRGFFAMPDRWRILGLVTSLMERIEPQSRQEILLTLVASSSGLLVLVSLADMALESKRDPSKTPKWMLDLEEAFPSRLVGAVGERLNQSSLEELISMPELDYIVHRWNKWGNPVRIREVFKSMTDDDNRLLSLLDKFIRTGTVQSGNRVTETYYLSLKSLAITINLDEIEPRVRALQSRSNLTVRQSAAISRYLKGMQLIAEGKDPDGSHFEDFDD
jgi:hypothetical protein